MKGATGVRICTPSELLAMALVVMSTAAWGLDTKATRESLRGLTGVEVVVENVPPDLEPAGLTANQLRTDAELRLRKAGIRVLTREETLATPGVPYLYIRVTGLPERSMTGRLLVECPRIMSTDVDVSSCKIGSEYPPHRVRHRVDIGSSDRPWIDCCR